MFSPRYPLYVGLLVEGVWYDALEFSAAGLSLTQPVVETAGLQHLRRGDEATVTLCVVGAGWQEEYEVTLRLAARGPDLAGFAFVLLPPRARRVLERRSAGREEAWRDESAPNDVFSSYTGEPAPFAFARLAEPAEASRRFILSISAAVFALTQLRSPCRPTPDSVADDAPSVRPKPIQPEEPVSIPASTVLVCAVALVVVLLLSALMAFG